MVALPSRVETADALGDIARRLATCIQNAWDAYHAIPAAVREPFTRRTAANAVNDLMHRAVKLEFVSDLRVKVAAKGNAELFIVDERFCIKLKKYDRNLFTSNIPTQLVLDFLNQDQLTLPGITADVLHLEAGYQPTITGLGTPKVWITMPLGPRRHWWTWELTGNGPEVQPLPLSPAPTRPPRPRLVRPKRGAKKARPGDEVRAE